MPAVDYKQRLLKDLKDLKYAAGYLTAALCEGEDVFLLALRDVVQAQLGTSSLAQVILGLELSLKRKLKSAKAAKADESVRCRRPKAIDPRECGD